MSQAVWVIGNRIRTRHLFLLVALAEEGNIHRAAEVLSMTQPAASKLLKDLEHSLGVPLFKRLSRGVVPTEYGLTLIRHARQIIDSLGKAQTELNSLRFGQAGHVSVGCITSPSMHVLPKAVAMIKKEAPYIQVTVEIESSDILMDRLKQDKLDMMVGRIFAEHDSFGLSYLPVSIEPVVAVVRPGHPMLARSDLTLKDVVDCGWIVPASGAILRHQFELMFHRVSLPLPTNLIETSAPLFTIRMLEHSDMLALLTTDVMRYCVDRQLLCQLPLNLPCQMDDYGLIRRTDRVLSPAAQRFYDLLAALIKAGWLSTT